jgi:hypothetical protein
MSENPVVTEDSCPVLLLASPRVLEVRGLTPADMDYMAPVRFRKKPLWS